MSLINCVKDQARFILASCVWEDSGETEPQTTDNRICVRLLRTYHPNGTHGTLYFPDTDETIETLELPWNDNEKGKSCIPEGTYALVERESPIVERTSKGKYKRGYEITNVDGRTFIMFHIGNYIRDTDGCVLTGQRRDFENGVPVIWSSGVAFTRFMALMKKHRITHIIIEEEQQV